MTDVNYLDGLQCDNIDVFQNTSLVLGANATTVDIKCEKPLLTDFILSNLGSSVDIEQVTISLKKVEILPNIFWETDLSSPNVTIFQFDGADTLEYDCAANILTFKINGGIEFQQASAGNFEVVKGIDTLASGPPAALLLGETNAVSIIADKDLFVDVISANAVDISLNTVIINPGAITFPGGDQSPLSIYESNSLSMNMTGAFSVNQPVTIEFIRIGKHVTLEVLGISAAAAVNADIRLTANLPARLSPLNTITNFIPIIENNSVNLANSGLVTISFVGMIIISIDSIGTNFTGTNNNGFSTFTISYKAV